MRFDSADNERLIRLRVAVFRASRSGIRSAQTFLSFGGVELAVADTGRAARDAEVLVVDRIAARRGSAEAKRHECSTTIQARCGVAPSLRRLIGVDRSTDQGLPLRIEIQLAASPPG